MDNIKFTANCKNVDGSIDSSEITINDSNEITFENSSIPSPNDPYYISECIEITSYEELKSYIVEEDGYKIYADFKGKQVIINIIADDDHWVKDEDDGWKFLYIVGQFYNPNLVSIADIPDIFQVDGLGFTFGMGADYGVTSFVVFELSDSTESVISVVDRMIGLPMDY